MDISTLAISQIAALMEKHQDPGSEMLRALADDPRSGVKRLLALWQRRLRAAEKESCRLALLYDFEEGLGVCAGPMAGVDEAGRGPLAGPVVAAAVILQRDLELKGLDDSKKLPLIRREALAAQIKKMSKAWAIGMSTTHEIFHYNIHQASLMAMARAVEGLKVRPGHVLVDGPAVPALDIAATPVVGGDARSASIAAASILAKVTRDRFMEICHQLYPAYGFDMHKGYPTPLHIKRLRQYGPCPLHRVGFEPVKVLMGDKGIGLFGPAGRILDKV